MRELLGCETPEIWYGNRQATCLHITYETLFECQQLQTWRPRETTNISNNYNSHTNSSTK
jgi:hypothetical protein